MMRIATPAVSYTRAAGAIVDGMDACASAYYWSREIGILRHEVNFVPPVYMKPSIKYYKNDTSDAEAICEVASSPTMKSVAVKIEV